MHETIQIVEIGGGWFRTEAGEKIQLSKAQREEGYYEIVEEFEAPETVQVLDSANGGNEADWTEGAVADVSAGEETQQPVITREDIDARVRELEAELADRDAKLAEKDQEIADRDSQIDDLRPTRPVEDFLFETPDDVRRFYGDKRLREMVMTQIAQENKRRVKEGLDRLSYSPEELEAFETQFIQDLLGDRDRSTPPRDGWLARSLKMIRIADDGTRTLIQIPYEAQVNNVAGSIADGYVRYERKGYKRTRPMLCPTFDCWLPAAVDDSGEWEHKGYCSEDHEKRTERQKEEVPA